MGFLRNVLGAPEPPTPGREYLARAPLGPTSQPVVRKSSLYTAALNQIAELPVAAAEAYGRPITDTFELAPATTVVRDLLMTDRALRGWVAREGLVLLDVMLENMSASWAENLDTAMASVGLEPGPSIQPHWRAELPPEVCERAAGLASCALQMFWVIAQPQQNRGADRTYYNHIFSSTLDAVRETAYDITAWSCVVTNRLVTTGRAPRLPFFDAALRQPPAMSEPGWYPNPFHYGEIVNSEATYQRRWDGTDWTGQIRQHARGRWQESFHSVDTPPDN